MIDINIILIFIFVINIILIFIFIINIIYKINNNIYKINNNKNKISKNWYQGQILGSKTLSVVWYSSV